MLDQDFVEKCKSLKETWWIQKQVLPLTTIHIGVDIDNISKLLEDGEVLQGVLNSAFQTRKAYANKWQQPPGCRKNQLIKIYEGARLLVNGYSVEITAIYGMSQLNYQTENMKLASEIIAALSAESLSELQIQGIKKYMGIFISNKKRSEDTKKDLGALILSRLQPYTEDPIRLILKETLNTVELSKHIEKVQEEYKKGLRGCGSRSKL